MLNFTTFRSNKELERYISKHCSYDLHVRSLPSEYPCIGFIYMCADESYDMKFLYKPDIQRMSDDMFKKEQIKPSDYPSDFIPKGADLIIGVDLAKEGVEDGDFTVIGFYKDGEYHIQSVEYRGS